MRRTSIAHRERADKAHKELLVVKTEHFEEPYMNSVFTYIHTPTSEEEQT